MTAPYRSARNALYHLGDGGRGPTALGAGLTALGALGLALCLTVLWWNMRAVMEVGGMCAEGGPYVIETPCPDGAAWMMPLSIVLGLVLGLVWVAGLSRLDGRAVPLFMLAWGALFGSLGWNFLEYGFDPPGDGGVVWGWLVCGVVFWIMALPGFMPLWVAARTVPTAGSRYAWALAATAGGAALGIWLGMRFVHAVT